MERISTSRVGETVTANNGLKMTVIAYRNNNDIDIRFEDGTVVKHKRYAAFKNKKIAHPCITRFVAQKAQHIGEKSIANGLEMTIIAYRNNRDIDIQFEDGTIVEHKRYASFKNREITPPYITRFDAQKAQHIGEKRKATNGLEMTIITYRRSKDVDVQFETGEIREHIDYKSFKQGTVALNRKFTGSRAGETTTATNGLKMTVVAYRKSNDIDVQFEDGTIVTNKSYVSFKKGTVAHSTITCYDTQKAQHIGEKRKATNGLEMTIIAYRRSGDIDVQFEDGVVATNKTYGSFKKGTISRFDAQKAQHIGEKRKTANGLEMTIIAYRKDSDIDVQFETGEIREHINYGNFCKGKVALANIRPDKQSRVGETVTANNGLKMTIIAYRKSSDIDVQFETGEIRSGITYYTFSKGLVKCDKHCNDFRIGKAAYEYNSTNNFYCHCEKCGKSDIMTVEEMKQHKCDPTPLFSTKNNEYFAENT